jgi:hypothetical protein
MVNICKAAQRKSNVNIKRVDSDYHDLIENIKGKTVDHIVANSEKIPVLDLILCLRMGLY